MASLAKPEANGTGVSLLSSELGVKRLDLLRQLAPHARRVAYLHEYGALMSYGPDLRNVASRAAYYVDKILKGAEPSEQPVEQISQVDLIIDLRVARDLGINVPQELLFRANRVIR